VNDPPTGRLLKYASSALYGFALPVSVIAVPGRQTRRSLPSNVLVGVGNLVLVGSTLGSAVLVGSGVSVGGSMVLLVAVGVAVGFATALSVAVTVTCWISGCGVLVGGGLGAR